MMNKYMLCFYSAGPAACHVLILMNQHRRGAAAQNRDVNTSQEMTVGWSGLRVHREFSPHPEVLSGTAKRGTLALGHNAGPVPLPTAWRDQAHQSLSMLARMEE
ncbi:unnamed protein product [Boreogadus saida]